MDAVPDYQAIRNGERVVETYSNQVIGFLALAFPGSPRSRALRSLEITRQMPRFISRCSLFDPIRTIPVRFRLFPVFYLAPLHALGMIARFQIWIEVETAIRIQDCKPDSSASPYGNNAYAKIPTITGNINNARHMDRLPLFYNRGPSCLCLVLDLYSKMIRAGKFFLVILCTSA